MHTVTDADRRALVDDVWLSIPKYLHKTIMQAFAAHRIEAREQALEEAAQVADDAHLTMPVVGHGLAGAGWRRARQIATAIRALKEGR